MLKADTLILEGHQKLVNYTKHESQIKVSKTMGVRREVGRATFPKLAGLLVDLKRYESNKAQPDQEKLNFYTLAAKALFAEHARFRHFNDDDVEQVFSTISPIIKACIRAESKEGKEHIIARHKNSLLGYLRQE